MVIKGVQNMDSTDMKVIKIIYSYTKDLYTLYKACSKITDKMESI